MEKKFSLNFIIDLWAILAPSRKGLEKMNFPNVHICGRMRAGQVRCPDWYLIGLFTLSLNEEGMLPQAKIVGAIFLTLRLFQ